MMALEFTIQEYIGSDGILHLNLDTAMRNAKVAIKVVVEPTEDHPSDLEISERLKALDAYFANDFPQTPVLSDQAISGAAIYGDRE